MKFRIAAVAVGVVAIAGVSTGVAVAESGPAPYLKADRTAVSAGESIRLNGSCAGETPSVSSDAFVDGSAVVDKADPFTADADIADVPAGQYQVTLRCSGGNPGVEPVLLNVA